MRYARILASIFLFSVIAFAQNEIPTRITNQNHMGDLPYSASIGTDIEHVDMSTGALNINIPVWDVPGRADASLAFHWSSNYFTAGARTDSDVTGEICTRWNERESTWRKSGSWQSRDTNQSRS